MSNHWRAYDPGVPGHTVQRDRANLMHENHAVTRLAAFASRDRYLAWISFAASSRGNGTDRNQATSQEGIVRNNQSSPLAALLMPNDWFKIGEYHVPAERSPQYGGHPSRSAWA